MNNLVFAHVKGYPWWPGRLLSGTSKPVTVHFFGTNKRGQIARADVNMLSFEEGWARYGAEMEGKRLWLETIYDVLVAFPAASKIIDDKFQKQAQAIGHPPSSTKLPLKKKVLAGAPVPVAEIDSCHVGGSEISIGTYVLVDANKEWGNAFVGLVQDVKQLGSGESATTILSVKVFLSVPDIEAAAWILPRSSHFQCPPHMNLLTVVETDDIRPIDAKFVTNTVELKRSVDWETERRKGALGPSKIRSKASQKKVFALCDYALPTAQWQKEHHARINQLRKRKMPDDRAMEDELFLQDELAERVRTFALCGTSLAQKAYTCHTDLLKEYCELIHKQLPSLPEVRHKVSSPHGCSVIVLKGDAVVAGATVVIPATDVMYIMYTAVDDDHQGLGYGRRVLTWLKGQAAGVGVQRMLVRADSEAVGFFASLGFSRNVSEESKRWFQKTSGLRNSVRMEWIVDETIAVGPNPEVLQAIPQEPVEEALDGDEIQPPPSKKQR